MNPPDLLQMLVLVNPYLGLVEETLNVGISDIEREVAEMDGVWRTGGEFNGSAGRVTRLSLLKSYMIKSWLVQ